MPQESQLGARGLFVAAVPGDTSCPTARRFGPQIGAAVHTTAIRARTFSTHRGHSLTPEERPLTRMIAQVCDAYASTAAR